MSAPSTSVHVDPAEQVAPTARGGAAQSRVDILAAAAQCFRELGFSATSIDDVARRLGATKGMVYHHFRSKTDLFFEVYRSAMAINEAAIAPHLASSASAEEKLAKMAFAHARVLMEQQAYQRVLLQGFSWHKQGATTAAQRETLDELIASSASYEATFRQAIAAAAKASGLEVSDPALATKSFLAVLNSTVYWYAPRGDNPAREQARLARELVCFAMRGLGCAIPDNLDVNEETENE